MILAVLFTLWAVLGIQFHSNASISLFLAADLGIDCAKFAALVRLNFLPGVVVFGHDLGTDIIGNEQESVGIRGRS